VVIGISFFSSKRNSSHSIQQRPDALDMASHNRGEPAGVLPAEDSALTNCPNPVSPITLPAASNHSGCSFVLNDSQQ
jgi:hypothetical protein